MRKMMFVGANLIAGLLILSSIPLLAKDVSVDEPQAAQNLVMTKVWLMKQEVQLQLNSEEDQAGYLINLRLEKGSLKNIEIFRFGQPAFVLSNAVELRGFIASIPEEKFRPYIDLSIKAEEVLGEDRNFLERMHNSELSYQERHSRKVLRWLKENLSGHCEVSLVN